MDGQVQLREMPECRLITWNGRIERSETRGQNLDAVEFGACVVEGAKELLLDPIDVASVPIAALSYSMG